MYDPFTYWEGRAEQWIASRKPGMHTWWKEIEKLVDPDWKVLELGCGDGRWSEKFKNYQGSDISPNLLEYCAKTYPDKEWFWHDMRNSITKGDWDLIFTYTAWLHVSPKDIRKVKLPDTRYLFVEPHKTRVRPSEHNHVHDYEKIFGAKPLKTIDKLTLYARGL